MTVPGKLSAAEICVVSAGKSAANPLTHALHFQEVTAIVRKHGERSMRTPSIRFGESVEPISAQADVALGHRQVQAAGRRQGVPPRAPIRLPSPPSDRVRIIHASRGFGRLLRPARLRHQVRRAQQ